MDTTSSLLKSVTRRVWSPPQRPFRVCSHTRETRKGITAGTLEELQDRVCQVLLLAASGTSMVLVCEEDGTEVDSEDFFMALSDNTVLMALESGQTWKPQLGAVVSQSRGNKKPRNGKDIARVTFDLYRMHPQDVFGSLNVNATFRGLYSIGADFQCLGPKKILSL
ncbi:hypothetical protein CRUP_005171 [Coryphaenoides rupestris]|nr:hypothetical protein CRUP_005171 [Coryphaenoides rupestris]